MPRLRLADPPEPGTYGRVLRRYDRDPMLQIRLSAYDANVKSRPIEMFGVAAPTLFMPPGKNAAADRALKIGWKDETEAWAAHLAGEPDPRAKPAAPSPGKVEDPPVEETKPAAPSAVRESPSGIEPLPGLSPVNRKRNAARAAR